MIFSDALSVVLRAVKGGLMALLFLLSLGVRAESQTPITVGFYLPTLRDMARNDVELSLHFWLDELSRTANVNVAPVQFYDDIAVLKRDADAGKLNFMVTSAIGCAQNFADADLADGVTSYKGLRDDLILVVRRDAGIRTVADLAAKRLALLDGDGLSRIYLETLMMKSWGTPDWRRFGSISYESRSSKLAHRLFFNKADAALVYRNGYEAAAAMNPQIGQTLQVLNNYSFKTNGASIGLFSAKTAPELREKFIQSALKVGETARGRQVLQIYQADRLERSLKSDLQPYRDLLASHQALKLAAAANGKKAAK